MNRTTIAAALALALAGGAVACGDGGSTGAPTRARGEISVWYSNNAEEVAWAKQMVAGWNSAHADQKVTAQ
ncbi:sugar ABC transporter substrate-binding protein, partial [Kribbella sp. NPDC050241]